MGRPSNRAQRRGEIVAALGEVMSRRGYAGATVQEIATAAGLAPGLVHYHFTDKHEILIALGEQLGATVDRRYRERAATATTPRARLSAFIDAYVGLDQGADPAAVAAWAAIAAEAQRDVLVRNVYRRHVRRSFAELGRLFAAALRDERRRVRDVRGKAASVIAAIEGAFRIAVSAPGVAPRGFASLGIRRLAEALIAAEPMEASRA